MESLIEKYEQEKILVESEIERYLKNKQNAIKNGNNLRYIEMRLHINLGILQTIESILIDLTVALEEG